MRRAILFFLALLALSPAAASAADEPLAVVVPRVFAGHDLNAQELALIFKRKKLAWDDGTPIQPVNLPSDHPARRHFSQRILKSLPEAQTEYWNAQYFQGVFPPHVLASSEAVLRFVADTPGSIGYVPACKADTRVKVALWIDAGGAVVATPPVLDCSRE